MKKTKENKPIPKKRSKKLTLTSEQVDCLSSQIRVNIFEAIRHRKIASVSELAKDLKKSPHSIYFHLKSLKEADLIRVREYRRVSKRDEALYEVVSERVFLDRKNTSPAYQESTVNMIRIALRTAEREHQNARKNGISNELFGVLRVQAKLTISDAKELRKRITELGTWISLKDLGPGERIHSEDVAVTCLAVPLK